jgi:hypothetical protein
VRGRKPTRPEQNSRVIRLLDTVVAAVATRADWHPVDAVLFPGGFFRSPSYVGDRCHRDRVHVLGSTDFGRACVAAARRLAAVSPGVLIVTGVDSGPHRPNDHGDQMCVAFSAGGVAGIGRKVFPADGDTNGAGRAPLVCYADDYSSRDRVVALANGCRALLCACYDVFGVAEAVIGPTPRVRYIRSLAPNQRYDGTGAGLTALRRQLVAEWRTLLTEQRVEVALVAVHRLQQPGRDIFWQRHGLATASAALGGGLAVGAAFFTDRLPDGQDRWSSPLAACGVPAAHLKQGLHRPARRCEPVAALTINRRRNGEPRALVRLFDADSGHL